jgi:pimeloyl-ACP methyl ester carboxylesterase
MVLDQRYGYCGQVGGGVIYLRRVAIFTALGYCLIVFTMYWTQDRFLYDPRIDSITPDQAGFANVTPLALTTPDDEKLVAWYQSAAPGMPTILFFHGKGGSISGRPRRYAYYTDKGYGVLFLSYRGYGASSGQPSRDGLLTDAETAYDWLARQGIDSSKILLVGESMGTGVAVLLAAKRPVAAVSLEAAYSSVEDIAAHRYWWLPVHYLIKPSFDPANEIAKVHVPLLILHGDQDETTPIKFAKKLFAAANEPKEFVAIPGGTHAIFNEATWKIELAFFKKKLAR